jgi:cyclophilin family peptidyl-prolyl cis-trans isomerase/HEAT repeat protein
MQTAQHTDGNAPPRVAPLVRVAALALLLSVLLSPLQADSATRKSPTGATTYAQAASAVPRRTRAAQPAPATRPAAGRIAPATLLRIVRAEDERRWEAADLGALLSDKSAAVRARAALAAGRIGDEGAVAPLSAILRRDADEWTRSVAAFALGEIEAASGADALLEALRLSRSVEVRARALEALGKIAAALPATQEERRTTLGAGILAALEAEHRARPHPNRAIVLEGLTAALRSRHPNAPRTLALFLSSTDARLRADAANALARLRAKESLERLRTLAASDTDPVVRANAARALAAAEDSAAYDALLARATADADLRVRVSAIRALAALKDARATEALLKRAGELTNAYKASKAGGVANPSEANELLEIATTLGRLAANTNDTRATALLRSLREAGLGAGEVETAFARIAPTQYMREPPFVALNNRLARGGNYPTAWQSVAALAQGLGELAQVTSARGGNSAVSLQADAQILLRTMLEDPTTPPLAVPAVLQAIAAFKPIDLGDVLRARLNASDVIVRATAADLLSTLDPDPKNARALIDALPRALEEEMNDAALSILGALAKQKTPEALEAVRSALGVPDYVVRRRAVSLLRGDAPDTEGGRVETVATRNRPADYQRALARTGRRVSANVITDKGSFQIELLPSEAPLTVDNFVELARRGFFNNVAFHRVVPNFVIQGGDPRGDGNGGPGYQIRCEINAVPYTRGAVGMALSGKDTGGSQWFVTHSPQPHLDGGYTVFGRVTEGMEVVDRIAVGDRIHSVTVLEGAAATAGAQPARRRTRARP